MKKNIFTLSTPYLYGDELQNLKNCINTGFVAGGEYINKFEYSVTEYTNSKYAVSCINCSSALFLSLKLLEVKPGDEVIAPTLTFISPINAIVNNLANPIFMDCDNYFNIDSEKVIKFLKNETKKSSIKRNKKYVRINKYTNRPITSIIIGHIFGNAAHIESLFNICKEMNISIIEDAAESFGTIYTKGKFKGKHTGTIGDIGCLSFNGNKIITSGGGGMILTKNKKIEMKARYLINQAKDNSLEYVHNEIGYNFRLSNLHASLGVAQIKQVKKMLTIKREINQFYKKYLHKNKNLNIMPTPEYAKNNHWLNIIKNNKIKNFNLCINMIIKLNKIGILCRPIWKLNHEQKQFKKYQHYEIHNSKYLRSKSFCMPSDYNIKEKDIKFMVEKIAK